MGGVSSKKKEYKVESVSPVCNDSENYIIEKVVCGENDLQDGDMQEFDIGQEGKVLLVKENGVISALGTKCTHYGAPLIKGVLSNGQLRCPWHGACFNSVTGDIEDFPGLDSLPCYSVNVEHGQVKVRAPVEMLKSNKRRKELVRSVPTNANTFVVIGGGGAAQTCVETLRQEGFTGKLILITREKHLPYDRPKLSKALDAKAEDLYLRNQDFFKCADITVMLETTATGVDSSEKSIVCNDGKKIKYDSLMIATGGQPLTLEIPGSDMKNVCLLRTPEDGNYIAANAVGKAVVIIGSSFIGMEVASYLSSKARSINIIARGDVPFSPVFGEKIGLKIKMMFEEKGVIFHSNASVTQFTGNDGVLTGVELSSGDILPADLCVVGIGVKPNTGFLEGSGISMNERGHVIVDEHLMTNIDGVYACGDIVEFPLATFNGRRVNISHWQMAESHGHTAAFNMLGKKKPLHTVPFFWSMMFGKSFRYAGYGVGYDDIVIQGNVDELKFTAYFCVKDDVVAVCTINNDPIAAQFASYLLAGKTLSKDDSKSDPPTWFASAI